MHVEMKGCMDMHTLDRVHVVQKERELVKETSAQRMMLHACMHCTCLPGFFARVNGDEQLSRRVELERANSKFVKVAHHRKCGHGLAVPHVDLRVTPHLSCRNDVFVFGIDGEREHVIVVLVVELLTQRED